MNKIRNRLMSLFLVLVMCLTLVPFSAFAEETEVTDMIDAQDNEFLSELIDEVADEVHVHDYFFVDEVPATESEAGICAHYECAQCGGYFILDGDEYIEVDYSYLVIPPLESAPIAEDQEKLTEYSGDCGNGLRWTLNSGVLTITGAGNMTSYNNDSERPWDGYEVKEIFLAEGVISVGARAFYGLGVTKVSFPTTLIGIRENAFGECSSLTDVYYAGDSFAWNNRVVPNIAAGNDIILSTETVINCGGTDAEYFSIVVMENKNSCAMPKENLVLSENAVAECAGVQYKVDGTGTAKVDISKSRIITVRSEGYVTRTLTVERLKNDPTVYLQKQSDKPVISALWLRRDGGEDIDILHNDYAVMSEDESVTIEPEIEWGSHACEKLMFVQDNGNTLPLNGNSATTLTPGDGSLDLTKAITLYAKDSNGGEARREVKLYADRYHGNIPEKISGFNFKFADGLTLKLPDFCGPIAGTPFNVGLFNPVPVEIQVEGDNWYAAIGYNKGGEKKDGKWTAKSFSESVKDLKGKLNELSEAKDKIKELQKARKNMNSILAAAKGQWGIEADFTVMAYVEGTFDKNYNPIVTSSGGFILLEGKAEYTRPFVVWVVPCYWEIGFSGSIQAQFNAIFAHPYVSKTFTTELEIKGEVSVNAGAGIGIPKLLSGGGGIKGTLSADWKLHYFSTKYFGLKGSMNGYVKFNALWFSKDYDFDPFVERMLYEYWGTEGSSAQSLDIPPDYGIEDGDIEGDAYALSEENGFFDISDTEYNETVGEETAAEEPSPMLMACYDMAGYEAQDLSYLSSGSVFVPSQTNSVMSAGIHDTSSDQLIQNAYSEADPQVAVFDDGRRIAMWIGPNSEASGPNRLQLYYSYYSDGSWTDPALVEDDGTPDAYPDIDIINGTAFIVWTDFARPIADGETLDDISGLAEISAAVFDEETGKFTTTQLTPDSGTLNVNPVVCGDEYNTYAVWLRNGNNDWFGTVGGNQIMCSRFIGPAWEEAAAMVSNLNPVIDFDAQPKGGVCSAAYSMDMDGDPATVSDTEVFCDGVRITDDEINDSGVVCESGSIFWLSGNSIVRNGVAITDADQIIGSDRLQVVNGDTVVYVENDGLYSTLYAVCGGGDPIALSDSSSSIRYFNATADSDGSLTILVEKQAVIGDGSKGDPFGESEIVWFNAPAECDITLDSIDYDRAVYGKDASLELTLAVTNNSIVKAEGLDVTVEVPGSDTPVQFALDTALASGETKEVTVDLPVAEAVQDMEIGVTVLPHSAADAYPGDNTAEATLSYRNLALNNLQLGRTSSGRYVINADVVNDGYSDAENVKVSLLYGKEDSAPSGTVTFDRIPAQSGEHVSFTIENPETGAYYLVISSDLAEDSYGDNSGFASIASGGEEDADAGDLIRLSQHYLILAPGDSVKLECDVSFEEYSDDIFWSVENADEDNQDTVIAVSHDGTVTAEAAGTAYAEAWIEIDGIVYYDRCRIDVIDGSAVKGVSLPVKKATVELFRTDYAKIDVVLEMDTLIAPENSGMSDGLIEGPAVITGASFTDPSAAAVFDLRAVDDRTIEIIPKESALAAPGTVAKTYKSAITVSVNGADEFTTDILTLTVKKTVPKIKAAAVKFNSYYYGDERAMNFTGGTVTGLVLKSQLPAWMQYDGGINLALLDSAPAKANGKLAFDVSVDGFEGTYPVTVSYSVASVAPKLTFSKTSLTLLQRADGYVQTAVKKITPAEYEKAPVTLAQITEGTSDITDAGILRCSSSPDVYGSIRVEWGDNAPTDKLAHTYKVYYELEGKTFGFTVKTPKYTVPSMTLKTEGTIERNLPGSFIRVTPSFKNFNPGAGYSIELYQICDKTGNKDTQNNPKFIFAPNEERTFCDISLNPDDMPDAGTYYVKLGAQLAGSEAVSVIKFTVKNTAANKLQASAAIKASGSIDVIRPGTKITVTPTVRNLYGYVLDESSLVIGTMVNKAFVPMEDDPFDISYENGVFTVKAGEEASHTVKYYAVLAVNESLSSKPVALSVKMGSAKLTADVKEVSLLARDRYSSANVKLSTKDSTLSAIERVELASGTDFFSLTGLGTGTYAVSYKDNLIPAGFKAGTAKTVKLNVFLEGNTTAKPNSTISVKVTIK